MKCPMCQEELEEVPGNQINKDGVTLRCNNVKCYPQVVEGWGWKAKDAYEVILHKFGNTRK